MTHDYKRNGTTTLFAAISLLTGQLIGTCLPRHRHEEFLKHKHPRVKQWLKRHPRFHLHFIPTSSSWLNLIERWFREITDKRIRRGVFRSVKELITAIESYIAAHNRDPKTFKWTARAETILAKVRRARAVVDKLQSA